MTPPARLCGTELALILVRRESPRLRVAIHYGGAGGEGVRTMMAHLKTLWQDDEAASAVEYGLLVALIAAVIIVAVTAIGTNMSAKFTTVAEKLK
jgi:pilus assembly protein Flp/PilA